MYDLVIVGGGPAGASLARLVGGRLKTLVLERRELATPFRRGMLGKCCGGLLAPEAQRALARRNIELPSEVTREPQFKFVRALDLATGAGGVYRRNYLNIDREAFDRHLVSLASAAEWRFGAEFLSFENGFASYRDAHGTHRVECRFLVAADGATSRVRRICQPMARELIAPDRYIAVQELFAPQNIPCFEAYFDAGLTDFYAWAVPKREGVLFGAALACSADAQEKFAEFKRRLADHGRDFGAPLHREGALILRPSPRRFWFGDGNVFAVGEAGGFISSSSAEGLSFALNSALAAAEVLTGAAPTVAGYRRAARAVRLFHWYKRFQGVYMYTPFLRNLIFASGVGKQRKYERF